MTNLKDLKLDDVVDDLRAQAARRIDDLLAEGRARARKASGAPDDGAIFSAFALGIALGVVVGAVLAFLMSPVSGQTARRTLGERVERMRGEVGAEQPSGNGRAAAPYPETFAEPSAGEPRPS